MTTITGLSIEEAAEVTGVSRHTLRYYERIGLLPPVERAASGHRRYSEDDLGWVRFLTLLRRTGMSIKDTQRFVELTRAGDHTIAQRVEVLVAHRAQLVERLAELNQHLDAIEMKIDIYQGILAESAQAVPASVLEGSTP
jgi:DNA-binding transcriptional MerR regulator